MGALETLQGRGFVQQLTHEAEIRDALNAAPVTFYVGFDPTADSLHVGHLLQVMAMSFLQRAGHRVIAVVGGGTAQVGDPSGKSELRQMLDGERIAENAAALKRQLSRFLVLDGERGMLVDNADWLMNLGYIAFLRDIGRHFSVNRMLSAEAYKLRLEKGLSFIEFNYQLLQAYDFLELYRRQGCRLQVGGDDQWGNIVAGVDLIRRLEQTVAWGMTTPLLTTASGAKMGKTASGAVWLDPEKLAPFDYWQYWYNTDDRDVGRFLRLFTFMDDEQITALESLPGARINEAKRALANACTTLVHGAEEAAKAESAAAAMVGGQATDDMPSHTLAGSTPLYAALAEAGLAKSKSEGRRLIQGGGVKVDGEKASDPEQPLDAFPGAATGAWVVRLGKKHAVRFVRA
jgi:tyrosyl-tRNA synthetase